jgi:hypothetical protein
MSSARSFRRRRTWCSAALLLFCWLPLGCSSWQQQPTGTEAVRQVDWDESARSANAPGQIMGIDPQAQDIERRLGVR